MKKVKTLLTIFSLLITGKTFAQLSADLVISPVQIVDYGKFGTLFSEFDSRQDLNALREFIFILYDPMIMRPWEKDDYKANFQKRWTQFKTVVCPAVKIDELCQLPDAIDESSYVKMSEILSTTAVVAKLNDYIKKLNVPFYFQNIEYLEQVSNPEKIKFNFWMSLLDNQKAQTEVSVFGHKKKVSWREKEFFILYDVIGYRGGFFQEDSRVALVKDPLQNDIVMNLDVVKTHAVKFANLWKAKLKNLDVENLLQQKINFNNYDSHMHAKMFKRYENRFSKIENFLRLKLSMTPTEMAQKTLKRFMDERSQGEYPEEVFQYVTYELFVDLIREQAKYFAFASEHRQKTDFTRQVWESVLHLQTKFDSDILFFLLHNELIYEANSVLSQFMAKALVKPFFYDLIKGILGVGEYQNESLSEYQHLLLHPSVFDHAFLKSHIPAAFDYLKEKGTERIRSYKELSVSEQTEFWKQYLGAEKPNQYAIFRLAFSISALINNEVGKKIPTQLHEIRKSEFLK